ncbi:hypothetical protein DFH28DRAFT_827413, partial [Melampsora americana]
KKQVGEEISEYLEENGLMGFDGKSIEGHIAKMEGKFRTTYDFTKNTGAGLLDTALEDARAEKEAAGYGSDSEEWMQLKDNVKSEFDKKLIGMCSFYFDLLDLIQRRSSTEPAHSFEAGVGEAFDPNLLFNSQPHTTASPSSSLNDFDSRLTNALADFDDPVKEDGAIVLEPETSTQASSRRSSIAPSSRVALEKVMAPLPGGDAKSNSKSGSQLQEALRGLPSKADREAREQREEERWNIEKANMQRSMQIQEETMKNSDKVSEAFVKALTAGEKNFTNEEQRELSSLRLQKERLEVARSAALLAKETAESQVALADLRMKYTRDFVSLGCPLAEAQAKAEEEVKKI